MCVCVCVCVCVCEQTKIDRSGLVSLFNVISTFVEYLTPKLSLQNNICGAIQAIAGRKRGSHLPEGICPKVKRIAQIEFELANYEVTVQHVGHYITKTLSRDRQILKILKLIVLTAMASKQSAPQIHISSARFYFYLNVCH